MSYKVAHTQKCHEYLQHEHQDTHRPLSQAFTGDHLYSEDIVTLYFLSNYLA